MDDVQGKVIYSFGKHIWKQKYWELVPSRCVTLTGGPLNDKIPEFPLVYLWIIDVTVTVIGGDC